MLARHSYLSGEDGEGIEGFHGLGVLWDDSVQQAHHRHELAAVQGIADEQHPLASEHFQCQRGIKAAHHKELLDLLTPQHSKGDTCKVRHEKAGYGPYKTHHTPCHLQGGGWTISTDETFSAHSQSINENPEERKGKSIASRDPMVRNEVDGKDGAGTGHIPGENAAVRLPPPVLVAGVGPAVRLARELGLDVGALLLGVLGPRHLVVHPLPLEDVAPLRRLPHRERHRLILL